MIKIDFIAGFYLGFVTGLLTVTGLIAVTL